MNSESDRIKTGRVMVYHVTEAGGRHRFLTISSPRLEALGGTEVFEQVLGRQYKAFELMGSTRVVSSEDYRTVTFLDARGAEELHDRVRKTMAAHYPNSSNCLESWRPQRKESARQYSVPADQLPWRPMFELKNVPNLDLERVVLVLSGATVEDLVKPEFISVVRARGGMRLSELKEDVRRIVEPSLIRSIRGSA